MHLVCSKDAFAGLENLQNKLICGELQICFSVAVLHNICIILDHLCDVPPLQKDNEVEYVDVDMFIDPSEDRRQEILRNNNLI